ncbi:MAG: iron-regulated protein [Myxococcales bacterium]|nr:iron-regulated protein [Myxococcales bacterium]
MSTRFALFFVASLSLGCGSSSDDAATTALPENAADAQSDYAELVAAVYEDSVVDAVALKTAIDAFLAGPTDTTLEAARDAWLTARESYLQSEVFRFYDGPIDMPNGGPEGQVNAWPLDESYIDYVEGNETSGLISDSSVAITTEALVEANEAGGETNIATGFHAIEFLLWGQDQSETGPGARPASDFQDGGRESADRRRLYLQTVTDLLVTDLTAVRDAWVAGKVNYRQDFIAVEPGEALRRILTGMTKLTGFETGGERLQTAYDSRDQEDEHSCFSDNTHRDMVQDIVGIRNVWKGDYTRTSDAKVDGVGIEDVVRATQPTLADTISAQVETCLSLANALQPPFDQEIAADNAAGRDRVMKLITALRALSTSFESVFTHYGLAVPAAE